VGFPSTLCARGAPARLARQSGTRRGCARKGPGRAGCTPPSSLSGWGDAQAARTLTLRCRGLTPPPPPPPPNPLGSNLILLPKPPENSPYVQISAITRRRRIWLARAISAPLSLPAIDASGARGRKFESCRARSRKPRRVNKVRRSIGSNVGVSRRDVDDLATTMLTTHLYQENTP
jgi:hypothetical protein